MQNPLEQGRMVRKKIKGYTACRQHPIKILSYTTRNFWLLLIPLTRSLVAMRFDIAGWLKGAWLDILILSVILLFALTRWFFITFSFEDEFLISRRGFFVVAEDKLFYSQITSLSIEQGVLNRPFRACQVYIDTNAGNSAVADISLNLRKNDAERLFSIINNRSPSAVRYTFSPRKLHLVFFSLIFSSTLTGVILISTLMWQMGKIVGRELEERLLTTFNEVTSTLATRVPPIMVGLALIVLIGWLYSFVTNLLRHWSFSVMRREKKILIKSGFITKRSHILNTEKINYTDIRQSMLSKIFQVSSVHVHCSGYGKGRREIAVLLPITTRHEVFDSLHMLMPKLPAPLIDVKPRLRNITRFILPPLVTSIVIPTVAYLATLIFPDWTQLAVYLGTILEIPFVWLLFVKIFAFFTTGIGATETSLTLKYCQLYAFHTVIVPKERVCKVKILQSFLQKLSKNCTVIVYTNAEQTKSHRIKNLPTEKALEFLRSQELYEEPD